MIKKVLIGLSLILVVAVASTTQKSYEEVDVQTENYILKLKVEILELKKQNSELKNIIEQLELQGTATVNSLQEKAEREKAIAQLRSDLNYSINKM